MLTTTRKIPVLSIAIQRTEGPRESDFSLRTVADFDAADQLLRNWSWSAPQDGGYDKCDFAVAFADDTVYHGRYALQHPDSALVNLRHHIQQYALYHSGRLRPTHQSADAYAAALNRLGSDTRAYGELLDHYDI